jgi:hypothetical protein
MSTAQAMEFYGPVRDFCAPNSKTASARRPRTSSKRNSTSKFRKPNKKRSATSSARLQGDNQFDNIVRFMSGHAPNEIPKADWNKPGTQKCIALVYEGVGAVNKIRDVLGPTDPSKAPPGSIRREFGSTIMVNAAHASDSPENAKREFGIVKPGENNFKQVIEETFGKI